MIKIIVTGQDGQLGYEISQLVDKYKSKFEFIFTNRNTLDLEDEQKIISFINHHKPNYFVNCAAYTAVDKAETEPEIAMNINAKAPKIIANTCASIECKLIHISTDYVFDGNKKEPYLSIDTTNPLNVYGNSKLIGEQNIANSNCKSIIIRTSWVYSTHGKNFVKTMIKLMGERESINVVDDQIGNPTYAANLADAILKIIEVDINEMKINDFGKVYHYTNTGNISWFNFATEINVLSKSKCIVNPINSSSYPTPAKRSCYSVLNNIEIENDFYLTINDWKIELKKCLDKLATL